MEIKNEWAGESGSFYIDEGGEKLGEMIYSMPEKTKMLIEHTEVDAGLRGKNFGKELVKAAVDYARTNHLKINPQCSFARSVLKKNTDYRDVLA